MIKSDTGRSRMLKKSIKKTDLLKRGAIYLNRIEEGFEDYKVDSMEGTEEELYQILLSLYRKNGETNSFVDFYYYRLSESERTEVMKVLTQEEMTYITTLEEDKVSVFYPLDETLLGITAKLTAKEILFSTFYFTKEPMTVWGNYQLKYPVFRKLEDEHKE